MSMVCVCVHACMRVCARAHACVLLEDINQGFSVSALSVLDESLLWGAVLCIVGNPTASLASTH